MEQFLPETKELEKNNSEFLNKAEFFQIDTILGLEILLVTLIATGTFLDFYIHSHQGVSDPQRREQVKELLGIMWPLVKHIGNFGFTAAASIAAVIAKHLGLFLTESSLGKQIIHHGFKGSLALMLASAALVESFSNNHEFLGDFSMTALALSLSVTAGEMLLRKRPKQLSYSSASSQNSGFKA